MKCWVTSSISFWYFIKRWKWLIFCSKKQLFLDNTIAIDLCRVVSVPLFWSDKMGWNKICSSLIWITCQPFNLLSLFIGMRIFLKLAVSRAVEFFIRDKYEKKKYYDKNAVNTFNVSKQFHFSYLRAIWEKCRKHYTR